MNVLKSYITSDLLKRPLFINGYNFVENISSATRIEVAGLMPVATTEINGLMSSSDKRISVHECILLKQNLLEIYSSKSTGWDRKGGFILVYIMNNPLIYTFTAVNQPTALDVIIKSVFAHSTGIKFYTKDKHLYLYNNTAEDVYILGFSYTGISKIGKLESVDETYKEITPIDLL